MNGIEAVFSCSAWLRTLSAASDYLLACKPREESSLEDGC